MCIIIAKEKWADLPTDDVLKTCWDNNSDGAGIAWYDNDKGVSMWEKGFMTYTAFKQFLDTLTEKLDVRNTAMLLHFRITSKGETCQEQCHPFPVSSKPSWEFVKKLNGKAEMLFAHNGTMTSFTTKKDFSDTQTFGVEYLPYFFNSNNNFHKDRDIMKVIENIIGYSRLSILKDNDIELIGDWNDDGNGLYFSNTTYIKNRWDNYSYDYNSYYDEYSYMSNKNFFKLVKDSLDEKDFDTEDVDFLSEVEDRSYNGNLTTYQLNIAQEYLIKWYSTVQNEKLAELEREE